MVHEVAAESVFNFPKQTRKIVDDLQCVAISTRTAVSKHGVITYYKFSCTNLEDMIAGRSGKSVNLLGKTVHGPLTGTRHPRTAEQNIRSLRDKYRRGAVVEKHIFKVKRIDGFREVVLFENGSSRSTE